MKQFGFIALLVLVLVSNVLIIRIQFSAANEIDSICGKLSIAGQDSIQNSDFDYYAEVRSFKLQGLLEMFDNRDIGFIENPAFDDSVRHLDVINREPEFSTDQGRYNVNQQSINTIREKFINDKEALIDIFVCDSCSYFFVLTSDTFHLVNVSVTRDSLRQWIKSITEPLYQAKGLLSLEFKVDVAHKMYQQFFRPVEEYLDECEALIIVPDNLLIGFPFECLVVNPGIANEQKKIKYQQFENTRFLIHQYAISYNYSTSISLRGAESLQSSKNLGRRLITLGSIKDHPEEHNYSHLDVLQESPFAKDEIYKVTRLLWRYDSFTGDDLTNDILRNNSSNHRWVYLTTPVMIQSDQVDSSFIYLGVDETSHAIKKITIDDILECKFRSDMITLTRITLESTENLRSLVSIPEALLFAGARSVLHNLWRINDVSLSRFMSRYYYELKYKRETNAKALKVAKISSFKGTIFVDDIELSRAHPYFWATYILIGDPHVISPTFSSVPPRMVITIVYVIVLLLSFLIVRKTRIKQTE